MQVLLFMSFTISMLFYIWGESIILVALAHSLNGAVGFAANNTLFNEIDFVFFLTVVIVGGVFVYIIIQELKMRKAKTFSPQ